MSLEKVLVSLPADYPGAILIVQHMPLGFTLSLAERLNRQCSLCVTEAKEDDPIIPGKVYIAPAGYHLKLRSENSRYLALLSKRPRNALHFPSVDVLMESVAQVWPERMLGIIMTGMGNDGAKGIRAMKQRGAKILAQDEKTSVVFGMPKAAQLSGCVDQMVPLDKITAKIHRFK
jgi:two-component system chemotaxis response regulator CheB